jgi:BirA family biotin operon repressor/biotin-[acetyl-CoA-carboxylase] ligase
MHIKWIKLSSTHSTNSYISGKLKQGDAKEELIVLADYQDAGRGQGTHAWQSESGKNLLMSVLLFPAFLSASQQFYLSILTSLSICDQLEEMGITPTIKWPNDILVGNRKIAGILIEHGIAGNKISNSILGIGLNLNQTRFPDFPVPATSILLEKGEHAEAHSMAEKIVKQMTVRYNQLKAGAFADLERDYYGHLLGLNQMMEFRSEGPEFRGLIRGVNEYGELLVESNGETLAYGHQEIQLKVPG